MLFWYFLTGLASGVSAGLFGIGGGIIVVLILTSIFGISPHTANGISLVALVAPVGILGVIEYYKSGKIQNADLVAGVLIALGIFVGTYFGSRLAIQLSGPALRRAFALFLVLVGIKILWKG